MPTGYTAGILDGKITTFSEFAKTCMRAFGATIHMREEFLSKEYEPRVPDSHYLKCVEEAKKELEIAKTVSDEELLRKETEHLKEDKEQYQKMMTDRKEKRKILDEMLDSVVKWSPPSGDYHKFKNFMIEQLNTTIEYDGDVAYYEKEILVIDKQLKNLKAKEIRERMIEGASRNISYYTNQYNEDVKRCEKSNRWVTELLESIK